MLCQCVSALKLKVKEKTDSIEVYKKISLILTPSINSTNTLLVSLSQMLVLHLIKYSMSSFCKLWFHWEWNRQDSSFDYWQGYLVNDCHSVSQSNQSFDLSGLQRPKYSIQKVQKETFTNQRETSVCKPIFFSICLLFYIFIKQQPQVTREKWVFCDWLQEVACCQVGDLGYKNLRNANQKQFVS